METSFIKKNKMTCFVLSIEHPEKIGKLRAKNKCYFSYSGV